MDQSIKTIDPMHYPREQYQSFMTAPEWRNVEMVEEYEGFLREGRSLFEFPYFKQIVELWRVMYNSYCAARQYNSAAQIFFSEYMIMDLFVCVFTTFELLPKGIISLFISPFIAKENHSAMQTHLADFYQTYAQGLQTVPFFDHDYQAHRLCLSTKYQQCTDRTWIDWLSWSVVSSELFARQWISKPLRYFMHQDSDEGMTTEVLVKFRAEGAQNSEHASALFLSNLEKVKFVSLVNNNLYIKEKHADKDYISVYARIKTPRYKAFKEVVPELKEQGIFLRKIAGQDRVQIKCILEKNDPEELKQSYDELKKIPSINPLYTYQDHIHAHNRFCLFDVPVKNLHTSLQAIEETAPIEFIHNF